MNTKTAVFVSACVCLIVVVCGQPRGNDGENEDGRGSGGRSQVVGGRNTTNNGIRVRGGRGENDGQMPGRGQNEHGVNRLPKYYRITDFCTRLKNNTITTNDTKYKDMFTQLVSPCVQYINYIVANPPTVSGTSTRSPTDGHHSRFGGEIVDGAVHKMLRACREVHKQIAMSTTTPELQAIYASMKRPCDLATSTLRPNKGAE